MDLFSWFRPEKKNQKSEGLKTFRKSSSRTLTLDDIARMGDTSLAAKIEAVYSAWRDKSETIGQLPIKLYEKSKKGREEVTSGRNYRIFCQRPCEYLTFQEFMEMLVVSLERYGMFAAYVERNDRGAVMSIIPFRYQGNLRPSMDVNGRVYVTYTTNDGKIGDAYRLEDLFIVKNFTYDGYTPVSPLVQNARLLGIASAQENTQYESQTDGITARMYASTDQIFKDDNAIARLKAQFAEMKGPQGASAIPVFEQNLKLNSLKLTPAETELLKNREFTINRLARVFRVPLHRIGIPSTTAVDILALDEAYFRDSLNPILMKVEVAINELLPAGYELEFDRNAFYKGSPWRLIEHIEKAVKGGLFSINEGRNALGMEPVEGGDVFAIDNNNVVYGSWNELESMQERLYGANNQPKPTEDKPDGQ